jgi:hypothetical protein
MRNVTLLGNRSTYTLGFGGVTYEFAAGVPVSVPDAVADECRLKRSRKGEPIFAVGEFSDPDSDVCEILGVRGLQAKFAALGG